ncbi:MAG: hypothetical protein EAY72_00685 [Bacteroidetes bacterium]|nr:MAG: hypothetical protein EAY72_00685 [Bacteroidota bacterium]
MNYLRLRKKEKQFRAITSLSIAKFDELLPMFEKAWNHFIIHYNFDGLARVRPYAAKVGSPLYETSEKLFFILYYKKMQPLQEAIAASFDMETSQANQWIHSLSPLLEEALLAYHPKTLIEDVQFKEHETYITDCSEYGVQRDTYHQKEYYSGKKKAHTLKNGLIVSLVGIVLWVSPTIPGRIHDKKLMENITFSTPMQLLADSGFQGWIPENITLILPIKKQRNTKKTKYYLSDSAKKYNYELAQVRVKVENVLAGIKTLRIIKDKNRNYKKTFKNRLFFIAAALHNFRIS